MSNKRPNQNKRDNKPALSSSSGDKKSPPNVASSTTSASASDKPASSPAKTAAAADQKSAAPRVSSTASSNTSSGGNDGGSSKGWIAPVALLFGLVGTGFSAYLFSQLKALRETTTVQFQNQAAESKSSVATVQTDLEEKTTALTSSLEEKTASINTALEEKNAALTTALEEKSAALTAALEESNASLTSAIDEKTSALSNALEEKSSSLATALEEKSTALSGEIQSSAETLRDNSEKNTTEIATSTATVVQELTSKTELEINNVSTSFNTGLALIRERNTDRFSELEQKLGDLDTSVQTTNEIAMRGQRDWVLAEVNYLLRTGVHRVKLAGDMKAGVLALESASDRLHTLGDIDYLPVREQIAEEVAALRRVGPPDIEGLIFKLQHMSKRADALPLPATGVEKTKEEIAEDPAGAGIALGQSLINKLKGSVKIVPSDGAADSAKRTRKVKPTKEQLTASDSLRLHLQAARLSALRHDAANFTQHMDNAINYSSEIFDQEDDQVKTFISDLNEIRETNIVPKTPVLGSSLSLFNKIDSKRGSN